MAKHKPSIFYGLRWPPGVTADNGKKRSNGEVRTFDSDLLRIQIDKPTYASTFTTTFIIDRATARLLAKRILQCLEDTK